MKKKTTIYLLVFINLVLFFLGSVFMRSAGCIVNDILDKEFDAKVFRTKNRPIASGNVSIKLAVIYAFALCFLAFLVFLVFKAITGLNSCQNHCFY